MMVTLEYTSSYLFTLGQRVQIQRLFDDLSTDDMLLIVHIDRLTRRSDELNDIWSQFKNKSIRLVVLQNHIHLADGVHYRGGIYVNFETNRWYPLADGELIVYNGLECTRHKMQLNSVVCKFYSHTTDSLDSLLKYYQTQMSYSITLCNDHSVYTQRYHQTKDILRMPDCVDNVYRPFFNDMSNGLIVSRTSVSIDNKDQTYIMLQSDIGAK
ncbi:hypothetical protein SAMD00019534_119140 [Acytostelium subglobosum LB1]|uniref:hypothetical protein n=1 Tax=Acytostelium subglobosum LB1 TaxID=1410327 RepID=UPI000644C011|nr:hypothetical protein SAMD00019534_119140 [Acytostelium subglobosum LB1]GAM28738.1 hypothetical protein SAMD00019534_119140 [Acytostelium subglobosum LB1]|eukprot:XP_012748293.1 hypothetical protein SAMD00019534_119140 [Acytostelium subglobosum LB1]